MGALSTTPVTNVNTAPEIIPTNVVFVTGQNNFNELVLNNVQHTKMVMKSNINEATININTIQSGHEFTIYFDDNHQIYRIAGPPSLVYSMEHLKRHEIKINKVFTSVSGQHSVIFCLSNKGVIYGCTVSLTQTRCQLGLNINDHTVYGRPCIIHGLKTNGNIIDIKSARYYSIALCTYSNHSNVIKYWNRNIPQDVIDIIIMFYTLNTLYSTGNAKYGGHCDADLKKRFWSKIDFFEQQNVRIIKIATGSYHSLCLDSEGKVWSCGNNDYGQLGVGTYKTNAALYPRSIKYFVRYKIRIKSICCGHSHNLAVDYDKRLYSWGNNEHGQCGHGTMKNVNKPKVVDFFKKKKGKVVSIDCGTWHSCACAILNDKREYFLWGSNVYNECMMYDNNRQIVVLPHCINEIVEQNSNYKWIKGKI